MKVLCRPMSMLDTSAKIRPHGYKEFVLSRCLHYSQDTWCMEVAVFHKLREQFNAGFVPPPPPVQALPSERTVSGFEELRSVQPQNPVPPRSQVSTPPAASPKEPNPWNIGPGQVLKFAIQKVTGEVPSANCSCAAKARQMNTWGWWGCWRNRKTIAGWLVAEARKRGHDIETGSAATLIRAALKEVMTRQTGRTEPDEHAGSTA